MTESQPCHADNASYDASATWDVLGQVFEAFSMMPYLHGAIPATVDDVRGEVNEALDSFWPQLMAVLGYEAPT